MPCPARSPDLNIIENCWGDLARTVYANGRQFTSVAELQAALTRAWDQLPQDRLRNLYKSLPNHMHEVILQQGGSTHY